MQIKTMVDAVNRLKAAEFSNLSMNQAIDRAIAMCNGMDSVDLLNVLTTVFPNYQETILPREKVQAILRQQEVNVGAGQICYYPSVRELAEKAASSNCWSFGETFVYARNPYSYLILAQVAPASCEMMTMTHNGYHDVLTAYRFSLNELEAQLQHYMEK